MKNRGLRKVSAKWVPFFCLAFFLFGMLLTSSGRWLFLPLILGFLFVIDFYVGSFFFSKKKNLIRRLWNWVNDVAGFGHQSNRIHALFPGYKMNSNNSGVFLKASLRIRWKSKILSFVVSHLRSWVLLWTYLGFGSFLEICGGQESVGGVSQNTGSNSVSVLIWFFVFWSIWFRLLNW